MESAESKGRAYYMSLLGASSSASEGSCHASSSSAAASASHPPVQVKTPLFSTAEAELGSAVTIHRLKEVVERQLKYICLIRVGRRRGTGCLIRGNLLLTNAHVIKNEDDARNASIECIRVTGEDQLTGELILRNYKNIQLDPSFFVRSLTPEKDASGKQCAADATHLDYTLVGVVPGKYMASINQRTFSLFKERTYKEEAPIYILHHPKKPPICQTHTYGALAWTAGVTGKTNPFDTHYTALSLEGSSGGAAVSAEDGDLLYLHYQGEIKHTPPCRSTHSFCNAGIPINVIVNDIKDQGYEAEILRRIQYAHSHVTERDVDRVCKGLIDAIILLPKDSSAEDLKDIFEKLTPLIPLIHVETYKSLRFNLNTLLEMSVDLYAVQIHLALAFIQRNTKLEKESTANGDLKIVSMHYYGKALLIAEDACQDLLPYLYEKASKHLFAEIKEYLISQKHFEEKFRNALLEGDVKECETLLEKVEHLSHRVCNREGQKFIRSLYTIAYEILHSSYTHLQASRELLGKIKAHVGAPLPDDTGEWVISRYRREFHRYCTPDQPLSPFDAFRKYINEVLLIDIFSMIGDPPCPFDIRNFSPVYSYSFFPLQLFILIEDEEKRPYFEQLIVLLEIQIAALGQTPARNLPFRTSKEFRLFAGLHFNPRGNPRKNALIQTPESLAHSAARFIHEPGYSFNERLEHKLLNAQSVLSKGTLIQDYHEALSAQLSSETARRSKALEFLENIYRHYNMTWQTHLPSEESRSEFSLRVRFFPFNAPLTHSQEIASKLLFPLQNFLSCLSLYHHIFYESDEVLVASLEEIGAITPTTAALFQRALSLLKTLCAASLPAEEGILERVYQTVLYPAFSLARMGIKLKKLSCLDFPMESFQALFHIPAENRIQLIRNCVRELIELDIPEKEHKKYYLFLSKQKESDPLRQAYLEELEGAEKNEWAAALSTEPGIDGTRLSEMREDATFLRSIETLLIEADAPPDGERYVRVIIPEYKERSFYLKEACIAQLIHPETGNLTDFYANAAHRVSFYPNENPQFHFKQRPFQPVLEFAVRDLLGRLVGGATCPSVLARFEVFIGGKNKIFPVLISKTLSQTTLSDVLDEAKKPLTLDSGYHTLLLLAMILIRPGDGRSVNCVYDSERKTIRLIDNDVTFVIPVVADKLGKRHIRFSSILFLLNRDFELNEDAVKKFLDYSPHQILNRWIRNVEQAEERALSLFPTDEEQKRLYQPDKQKNQCSLQVLLRAGELPTLKTQFHFLQDTLSRNPTPKAIELLGEIIYLHTKRFLTNHLGRYIQKAYGNYRSLSPEAALSEITETPHTASISTKHALKRRLGEVPLAEKINSLQKFSLSASIDELLLYPILHDAHARSVHEGIEINFTSLSGDLIRQELLLESLALLLERHPARTLSLINCEALTDKTLRPLLSTHLQTLNVSGATQLRDLHVLRYAPNLEFLYANHCPNLEKVDGNSKSNYVSPLFPHPGYKMRSADASGYLIFIFPHPGYKMSSADASGYLILYRLRHFEAHHCDNLSKVLILSNLLKECHVNDNRSLKLLTAVSIFSLETLSAENCPLLSPKSSHSYCIHSIHEEEEVIELLYQLYNNSKQPSLNLTGIQSLPVLHAIANAMQFNTSVQSIVHQNFFSNQSMPTAKQVKSDSKDRAKAWAVISSIIANCQNLQDLTLIGFGKTDFEWKALATALKMHSLRSLYLAPSCWTSHGSFRLGIINNNLFSSDLVPLEYRMNEKRVSFLIQIVETQSELSHLSLPYSFSIFYSRPQKLALAIRQLVHLKTLDLSGSHENIDLILEIFNSEGILGSLRHLRILGIPISKRFESFKEIIAFRRKHCCVEFSDSSLSSAQEEEIQRVLSDYQKTDLGTLFASSTSPKSLIPLETQLQKIEQELLQVVHFFYIQNKKNQAKLFILITKYDQFCLEAQPLLDLSQKEILTFRIQYFLDFIEMLLFSFTTEAIQDLFLLTVEILFLPDQAGIKIDRVKTMEKMLRNPSTFNFLEEECSELIAYYNSRIASIQKKKDKPLESSTEVSSHVSLASSSSASHQQSRLMHDSDGNKWKIYKTMGDGACAQHAVLGDPSPIGYAFEVEECRYDFCEKFIQLKENNPERFQPVQKAYLEQMSSHIQEVLTLIRKMMKEEPHQVASKGLKEAVMRKSHELSPDVRLLAHQILVYINPLLELVSAEEEYVNQKNQLTEEAQLRCYLNIPPGSPIPFGGASSSSASAVSTQRHFTLLKILTKDIEEEHPFNYLFLHPDELENRIKTLPREYETDELVPFLKMTLEKIRDLNVQIKKIRKKSKKAIESMSFRLADSYLEALKKQEEYGAWKYWFGYHELIMVAHLYRRNVNVYEVNTRGLLESRKGYRIEVDGIERSVDIFYNGINHYERMEHVEESKPQ